MEVKTSTKSHFCGAMGMKTSHSVTWFLCSLLWTPLLLPPNLIWGSPVAFEVVVIVTPSKYPISRISVTLYVKVLFISLDHLFHELLSLFILSVLPKGSDPFSQFELTIHVPVFIANPGFFKL